MLLRGFWFLPQRIPRGGHPAHEAVEFPLAQSFVLQPQHTPQGSWYLSGCQTPSSGGRQHDEGRGSVLSQNLPSREHSPRPWPGWPLLHPHSPRLCASPSWVGKQGSSAHPLLPAGHLPGVRTWPLPSSTQTHMSSRGLAPTACVLLEPQGHPPPRTSLPSLGDSSSSCHFPVRRTLLPVPAGAALLSPDRTIPKGPPTVPLSLVLFLDWQSLRFLHFRPNVFSTHLNMYFWRPEDWCHRTNNTQPKFPVLFLKVCCPQLGVQINEAHHSLYGTWLSFSSTMICISQGLSQLLAGMGRKGRARKHIANIDKF